MATVAAFPTPDTTGIPYSRYDRADPEYDQVTYKHVFEDKGESKNSVNITAPQPWMIEFDGLLEHEAQIWRDHHALAFHDLHTFPYTDFNGDLYTGVQYRKYDCKPDDTGGWFKISIELVKLP